MKRLSIPILLGLLPSCSSESYPNDTARLTSPIELSGFDSVFRLATSLNEVRGADARSREAASLATGGLRVKFNEDGAPWMTAEGIRIGASCGVTFVAPSFAVTAAHCVDGNDTDESDIVVEMYRPTPELNEGFRAATVVSGAFPNYEHARLDATQGYHTDRYSCQVVSRCGDSFIPIACDAAVSSNADTALLQCEGRPGDKYGYVDVAVTDDMAAEVFMPWKHEVYDLESSPATDLLVRYSELPSTTSDNYHYHSVSSTGVENHQLLPLISVPFAPDTPHRKLSSSATGVTTDLLGCHGTSGSGIMQRGENGLWELLGPARYGEQELGYYLCNHIPALRGPEHGSGVVGVGYTPLMPTQHVVGQFRDEITLDCAALPVGATTLLTHLDCARRSLAADPVNAAFAALLSPAEAPSSFDTLGGRVVTVSESAPVAFTGFSIIAGERYRLGLEGAAHGGCSAGSCPELTVSVDGTEIFRSAAFDPDGENTTFAASLTATTSGTPVFSFDVTGGTLELGALSVVPADHTLRFDQSHERLGAVLVDTTDSNAAPGLMRFVGDGVEGFQARLLPSERMVLPHLALMAGHEVEMSFTASEGATLTCGLLGSDLATLSAFDCSAGTVSLGESGTQEAARALYVENVSSSTAALVDEIRVVTTEPVDTDADGWLDSSDDCPTGSIPKEAAQLTLNPTLEQALCVPAPTTVTLALPDLSSLVGCDIEVESAELRAVQGRALDAPVAIDVAAPTLEIGPGAHTVAWTLAAAAGSETVTIEQSLTVVHRVTDQCCGDDRTVWEGGPADESHTAERAVCAFAGGGADMVRGSAAADWLWGDSDADFLSGEFGSDIVLGGDGDDVLSGGVEGHAAIYAGSGNDTVQLVHAGSSLVYAGPGTDSVVGSSGDDTIYPGPGGSTILTGSGSDTVILLDACELTAGMVLDGGEGEDSLRSPLPTTELEALGITLRGFESVVVDTSRSYLAECFGDPS